ncbi:LPS assembly lipoprotein LptE [Legionella londiniensis]|uniref:LPS-assembly lipoprotein LptE n=1 Tax=Legionella londiniensis TaxID=45068 RepID=A0A0W0VMJ1_9GAMM|nr:LPS assembly lipoprotein LptE [Legionella londiniensis]KTD21251.1 rare lipoprotein B [Legionella londiniensis]STX93277.1 Rare lipoprotein B [Legionella londiniensis]
MRSQQAHWLKVFIFTFSFFFISGCGFHLRGAIDLPVWLDKVAIINQGVSQELGSLLSEQLEAYKIKVLDDPSLADYWLILEEEAFQQQTLSISSSTTPRQYQLNYIVRFKLQAAHGKIIIPTTRVMVTRQITINSDRILGSDAEEALTQMEMRRDAANQILNRISHK